MATECKKIKRGDSVNSVRYGLVSIFKIFDSVKEMLDAGYREPAFCEDCDDWEVRAKYIRVSDRWEFAAACKLDTYEVEITETLQKSFKVYARSADEACEIVKDRYYEVEDDYILNADNACGDTNFDVIGIEQSGYPQNFTQKFRIIDLEGNVAGEYDSYREAETRLHDILASNPKEAELEPEVSWDDFAE